MFVVQSDAADPPILGEGPRLWLDDLRGEDPTDRREQWIAIQELKVTRELLHTVDLTASFDLHCDSCASGVAAEDVYRSDRGHVFPTNQAVALTQSGDVFGEEFLEMGFNAIFDQAGINTEFVL